MTWKIKQMEFHVKPNLEVGGIEKHIKNKWKWYFDQSEVENSLIIHEKIQPMIKCSRKNSSGGSNKICKPECCNK
jgi:hypothetical protein